MPRAQQGGRNQQPVKAPPNQPQPAVAVQLQTGPPPSKPAAQPDGDQKQMNPQPGISHEVSAGTSAAQPAVGNQTQGSALWTLHGSNEIQADLHVIQPGATNEIQAVTPLAQSRASTETWAAPTGNALSLTSLRVPASSEVAKGELVLHQPQLGDILVNGWQKSVLIVGGILWVLEERYVKLAQVEKTAAQHNNPLVRGLMRIYGAVLRIPDKTWRRVQSISAYGSLLAAVGVLLYRQKAQATADHHAMQRHSSSVRDDHVNDQQVALVTSLCLSNKDPLTTEQGGVSKCAASSDYKQTDENLGAEAAEASAVSPLAAASSSSGQ